MKRFYVFYPVVFLWCFVTAAGCSCLHRSLHSAVASFPVNYAYRPSYETIGAMYKTDPALSIEFLERLSRRNPDNLAYRLTLTDMYTDAGRGNDAIRVWFEILDISRRKGAQNRRDLKVYFIPIVPSQEEGMRPYPGKIDKSLAYYNIALVYRRNAFYEEAAEYFSRAAENAQDLNRKAELYEQAGIAIGSKQVEFTISEEDGKPYQKIDERMVAVDPMRYRKKEMAFYLMALSLEFSNADLREKLEERLSSVEQELLKYEGKTPPGAGERNVLGPEGRVGEKVFHG